VTEADLAALGVHRIAVPVPFAAAGGPVNLVVVEEDGGGLTLFDAGLALGRAQAAIEAGFARLSLRFEDVRRIVVSHGHVDHFGAARFITERAGREVTVEAHAADRPKIDETGPRFSARAVHFDAHLERHGVPAEVREALRRSGEASYGLARRVPGVRAIDQGAVVAGRHVRFEVLHLPGHTPGLIALFEPRLKLLLPADHLLEKISPNPLIELSPEGRDAFFRPLVAYLASVERTRALDLELVLPGHGPPFGGHRAVIDGLTGFYAKRQARLASLLEDGPKAAWALCTALFPKARPAEAFLTMSETLANLEVLESRGEVVRREVAGGFRYERL
jgi:glyoxylase-like metal-dependent hydrolase (beta-lactamase superfamily II)